MEKRKVERAVLYFPIFKIFIHRYLLPETVVHAMNPLCSTKETVVQKRWESIIKDSVIILPSMQCNTRHLSYTSPILPPKF